VVTRRSATTVTSTTYMTGTCTTRTTTMSTSMSSRRALQILYAVPRRIAAADTMPHTSTGRHAVTRPCLTATTSTISSRVIFTTPMAITATTTVRWRWPERSIPQRLPGIAADLLHACEAERRANELRPPGADLGCARQSLSAVRDGIADHGNPPGSARQALTRS
jgi:hypothetical protein